MDKKIGEWDEETNESILSGTICDVCHENPATQIHHLSDDPEIVIYTCTLCHNLIHHHGTGKPGPNANIKTRKVGRPIKGDGTQRIISISLTGKEAVQALADFDELAAQRSISRSELLTKAMLAYITESYSQT